MFSWRKSSLIVLLFGNYMSEFLSNFSCYQGSRKHSLWSKDTHMGYGYDRTWTRRHDKYLKIRIRKHGDMTTCMKLSTAYNLYSFKKSEFVDLDVFFWSFQSRSCPLILSNKSWLSKLLYLLLRTWSVWLSDSIQSAFIMSVLSFSLLSLSIDASPTHLRCSYCPLLLFLCYSPAFEINVLWPTTYIPCFKYRPSQPRYRPISPFLPAADTIWENRSPYRLQQNKRPIFEISADKSPYIGW